MDRVGSGKNVKCQRMSFMFAFMMATVVSCEIMARHKKYTGAKLKIYIIQKTRKWCCTSIYRQYATSDTRGEIGNFKYYS